MADTCSRPAIDINKLAFTFDQVDLTGVVEMTVQGRGTLKIENISLTANDGLTNLRNLRNLRSPCGITCVHSVEPPANISLDVFEYHYLPPLFSAITVTIQGSWTHNSLSFPITISQTVPVKWCLAGVFPNPTSCDFTT